MSKSGITYLKHSPLPGYTGEAWNPIIGCTHSGYSGCDDCWARELHTMRHEAHLAGKDMPAQYHLPFERLQFFQERFDEPRRWRKPRLVMVCPQSDLFHEQVTDTMIFNTLNRIAECDRHQFFVLTKRPERAASLLSNPNTGAILPNLGVLASVSDQVSANALIPHLLQIHGVGWRGVSYEPAVGPIKFNLATPCDRNCGEYQDAECPGTAGKCIMQWDIDLVIAGCESGRNRRPAQEAWFADVCRDCERAGVPFYLKQIEQDGKVIERPAIDGRRWEEWVEVRHEYA